MVYTVQSIEGPQIYADDAETTLQTAINNAENGAVITATRSFALDATVTVPAGKTVTLTDGGKNLTAATIKNFRRPGIRNRGGRGADPGRHVHLQVPSHHRRPVRTGKWLADAFRRQNFRPCQRQRRQRRYLC